MGGRKRVRARCVRMPKASMQRVHVSIYSFPLFLPLFRKFYYRSTSTGKKPSNLPPCLLSRRIRKLVTTTHTIKAVITLVAASPRGYVCRRTRDAQLPPRLQLRNGAAPSQGGVREGGARNGAASARGGGVSAPSLIVGGMPKALHWLTPRSEGTRSEMDRWPVTARAGRM